MTKTLGKATEFATFDFGLSEAQEERAARLHAETVIVDMLFQGPCGYLAFDDELLAEVEQRRQALGLGDPSGDFASAVPWVSVAMEAPLRAAMRGDGRFRDHWEQSGIVGGNRQLGFDLNDVRSVAIAQVQFDAFPWLAKGLRASDFREAKERGQRVGYVTTQDSGSIGDVRLLDYLHDAGLRVLGLTYNMQNRVGGGCTERTDTGVSTFGAKLIARCDELGVIVDTAHSSRSTTLDACELSRNPVIASHTTAAAVYPHDRAKGDDQLQALAATGGLIGINAVPFFLGTGDESGEGVTIESMLDHIDHVTQLVGWEHVGIGTDWPLPLDRRTVEVWEGTWGSIGFRDEHNVNAADLIGFRDYRDFPNVTRGLVARGYSDEQVRGILGENFLRVFERICG
jgi:membrane dipeptidase